MKKLLGAALALLMGTTCAIGFTACGDDDDNVNYEEVVANAKDQISMMYDKAAYAETDASFAVLGKTQYNGVDCTVTWTVSSEVAAYMSVGTTLDAENKITISVNSRPETDIAYILTATVSAGDKSAKRDFNRTLKGQKKSDVMTVAELLALDKTKTVDIKSGKYTNKYYSEDGTTAKTVTVKGYVVDAGEWSDEYSNYSNVYIADEYSDSKNSSSKDALQVYRIKNDSVFVKAKGDICRGDLITFEGCVQIYNNNFELNYCGEVNVTCKDLVQDTRTGAQRAEAAINEVEIPASVITDLVLPDSTFRGVTLSISSSNTAVIANDGTVTRPAADAADANVTVTVTATCDGATKAKDFPVTVKKISDIANAGEPASLAFTAANRTKFEADQVVIASGSVTATLDKASSTTACNNGNYTNNHLRAYKGSKLTIAYTGITKVVFHCEANYSIEANLKAMFPNAAVSVVGNDVTIEFDSAVNEVIIDMSVGQARIVSIDINPAA